MYTLYFNIPNKKLIGNKINRNDYNLMILPFIVIYKYFFWNYENLYFLLLTTFQLLTLGPFPKEWSPTGPYSTAVPLLFCILLEIISATYIWFKNYKNDYIDNTRKLTSIHNKTIMNRDIYPGHIIKLYKDEICPFNGILIEVGNNEKYGKISLALLTGESNIHYVEKPIQLENIIQKDSYMEIYDTKIFSAKLIINNKIININDSNIIVHNSIIKSSYVYIWVTSCNNQLIINNKITKKSRLDTHITSYMTSYSSKMLVSLILLVSCIKIINAETITLQNFLLLCLQNWICFNGIIPFSVKIFLILIRSVQTNIINTNNTYIVNTSNLIDDIAKVRRIICDKTGTLTKNELEFSKLIQVDSKEIIDVSNYNQEKKIDINLMKCLGLCIHQSDGNFNTVEDQIIRYRFQLLNSKIHQEGNNITLYIDDMSHSFKYIEIIGLDFTFDRKLSSKVVKDTNGKYYIFTKGSLDKIKLKIQEKYVDELTRLDNIMSADIADLRLLALAYREIDPIELNKPLTDSYNIISQIENNLQLLGIIGIKDNIQDNVKETINMFHDQNIYCCMCTGDRKITALSVAKEVGMIIDDTSVDLDRSNIFNRNNIIDTLGKTLIISGNQIDNCLINYENMLQFKKMILNSKNFIAYNLIPQHKRILTDILETSGVPTLTIGDGFNDISMFDRSQISVSIKGTSYVNESSNFVIDKFRDLIKLFEMSIDHYYKNSLLTNYTFYRCVSVVMCLVTFSIINHNKLTTSIFSGFVIQAFNFLWCIIPLIVICLTPNNKKYFNKIDIQVAKYHKNSTNNITSRWIIEAFIVGVLTTIITYIYNNNDMFSDILAFEIICILNIRLLFYFNKIYYIISLFVGPLLFVGYCLLINSL